jgi:hypothetical protein
MKKEELIAERDRHIQKMNAEADALQDLNEALLSNIKKRLPELEELLKSVNADHCYDDMIYRFYHQSLKVYWVQDVTEKIVKILKELAPEGVKKFNGMFEEIFKEGTGKKFSSKHNENWMTHTRPLLEAFFHAKYMLEMAVKYGKELKKAPTNLPSGWAAILELYRMR